MRARAETAPRLRVGFVLTNRFTLTAFSCFIDALRLASDEGDRSRQILCRWTLMSSRGRPVKASCGAEIASLSSFVAPKNFDYLVVVGGLLGPGAQADEATLSYLRAAAEQGVTLIGVCTGSFVLARAGLLKGRRACVSWFHRDDFLGEFDDVEPVTDRLYLIDGDRITCSGGAGVADLAAALIARRLGAEAALKSLRVLQIDGARAENSPQPMPSLAVTAKDDKVRRAILYMERRLSQPKPVARIAAELGVSPRQLECRFPRRHGAQPRRRLSRDAARLRALAGGGRRAADRRRRLARRLCG